MGNAQLVAVGGAVVGGVIGSFFGPGGTALGAQIGFAAGSLAGNAAFPPEALVTQGPRLGDSSTSTSAYGIPRPIGYGTMRMGGNLIWELPKREQKNKKKISGGKGGGGTPQKQITYSYFQTFAMAFGEGPAQDVLRIWADNKIIFDKTNIGNVTRKEGLNFRFYPGDETQLPDPAIETNKGVGQTPAFRGTPYIVFDDLALKDYGNRMPNITAQIGYTVAEDRFSQTSTPLAGPVTTLDTRLFGVDWTRGFGYVARLDANKSLAGLRKFRLSDMTEVQQVLAIDAINGTESFTTGSIISITPNGDIITGVGGGNSFPLALFDGNTLREKARFGIESSGLGNTSGRFERVVSASVLQMFTQNGVESFLLTGSIFNSAGLLRIGSQGKSLLYVWDSDTEESGVIGDSRISAVTAGKFGEQVAEGYIRGDSGPFLSSAPINIYKLTVSSSISVGLLSGPQQVVEASLSGGPILSLLPNDLFPGTTQFLSGAGSLVYDMTDDTLILSASKEDGTGQKWFKYNPRTGAKIWETELLPDSLMPNTVQVGEASVLRDGTFGYIRGINGVLINTVTGELLFKNEPPSYPVSPATSVQHSGYYNSRNESFVSASTSAATPVGRWFFKRSSAVDVPISTIIADIIGRAGLTLADITTTSINALTTPGFLIGRQTSVRAAIQTLMPVYFFDGAESDHKLNFVLRGGIPIRTIPSTDLIELDKSGKLIDSIRAQEIELPERVSINFMELTKDFLSASHQVKRIRLPTNSSFSENQVTVEYPGALRATFAKQTVEKILYSAWIERTRHRFKVPWQHMDLDPTDVIFMVLPSGNVLRGRLTIVDIGTDFQIEGAIVEEELGQIVNSSLLADEGSGQPIQIVKGAAFVFLKLLDIPLLRDINEFPGRIANPIYGLMGSMEAGQFRAGTVFVSRDGINYEESNSFVSEMNWGIVTNVLGDPPENDQTDETNFLTVSNISGIQEASATTQLDMLNGANGAAVMKADGTVELLQYRDVVDNGDGTFTLSGLLRGRRGTELFATGHKTHELILLLDPVDMEIFARPVTDLGVPIFYRAIGDQQLFEDGQTQTLISQANALKPYAVVHHAAAFGISSSIDISWVRRTRVGGALQDGVGTVPLNEDDERYELEIFNAPGGTLVRTVVDILTPAYNYTSADQTTDGFTPPISSVTMKVYQISGEVGRGFSTEVTINVE